MDSPLLTTLDGRRRFVDTFDALRWQTVAGTLTVSGGALQASALGDWGANLITNGEFTTNTDGWTPINGTATRRDSTITPGTLSPGDDKWCIEIVNTSGNGRAFLLFNTLVGVSITYRGLLYSPSSNTEELRAALQCINTDLPVVRVEVTAEDEWQALAHTLTTVKTTASIGVVYNGDTAGDVVYGDAMAVYRQNAAAIRNVAPAFRARLAHISPAAPSVVPAGWMFRYTDLLNYWELRLLPNTAGNDMQIVQVTAGAETVRAEADIDWTAEGTDEIELTVRGSNITTRYKKAGGVWTSGPSYSSATQGAQSPYMGPMLYGTTTARWARAEVDW